MKIDSFEIVILFLLMDCSSTAIVLFCFSVAASKGLTYTVQAASAILCVQPSIGFTKLPIGWERHPALRPPSHSPRKAILLQACEVAAVSGVLLWDQF